MTANNPKKSLRQSCDKTSFSALTAAALLLPGLPPASAQAAEDDSVDFQYSHYQEGKRDIYGYGLSGIEKLPQNLNPIEVDSVHGSGRFTLTDRIKFAFNYTQDTWSGATPIGTAPTIRNGNLPRSIRDSQGNVVAITGASPLAGNGSGLSDIFVDRKGNFYDVKYDPVIGDNIPGLRNNQLTHVLSFASPEIRKQGDFKLSYESDNAAIDVGGGISIENDYESRFGNLGGRFDFNQKQTSFNWGVSYTNSDTFATLDPDALTFINTEMYDNDAFYMTTHAPSGYIESTYATDEFGQTSRTSAVLRGNRQDWGSHLGLTQVLDKDSLTSFDLSYTRSTGYLANPYKVVYGHVATFDPGQEIAVTNLYGNTASSSLLEIRPDERNLLNWHLGYDRYIEPMDAAFHFDYSFAHDDWGINAHTFEADWVQPLGASWTVTPRIRYYSQSAADFYTTATYKLDENIKDADGNVVGTKSIQEFPKHFSSDQRLSDFGTLSGGVTVEKQFTKGVSLETGFEYYTHQGSLKLGGGGEQAFADYDYWVANAALKVNLGALNAGGGGHDGHGGHHHHSNSPAGVMFDHTLPKAGDFMAGYRFMRNEQAGDMLFGSHPVGLDTVNIIGCDGESCAVTPNFMAMSMHMLDLMYAPTDWLTLMLMPQWMDMKMKMAPNDNFQFTNTGHGGHSTIHAHQTGGIGDFGAYALFKAFDRPNHHLTLSLGVTAPTGDVDIVLRKTGINPVDDQLIHYGMQLGSGTWDFKPALTYTGEMDSFLWGAQANATVRLESKNESGYRLGDIFQGSVWGGYNWTNWLATTVRGIYTWQDRIHGLLRPSQQQVADPNTGLPVPFVPQHIGPFDFPGNYGGQFVDLGLGVNVTVPSGAFQGNSLKFEWLQPVHTDYNGYQLDRDYSLNFTWSYGF
ncbi:MAG: DUF3570 domain-containing protein [Methyloglobulus sp.]|nr:DUF3570 domain-containing protein [Methyloglobulus sp.]